MIWIAFFTGIIVGAVMVVVIASCCVAGDADEWGANSDDWRGGE